MASKLNPYLHFGDTARQAMEFYKSVFGGDLLVNTFAEGMQDGDPGQANKTMHAQLETPAGFTLMASDTPKSMGEVPPNGRISVSGDDEKELRGYWDKLNDGGAVVLPLMQAPWGDTFGMVADRFGVTWLVNIAGKPA